jgi:two-component system chemotaxis sensor kinase CheA
MDDLLHEFLTETFESLDVVNLELVRFEKDPGDKAALDKIFRLVHTIKGTCGFLGLSRLEALAHASETVLGQFRDGALDVTPPAVSLILGSIDRIKEILLGLEAREFEPVGDDRDLIAGLNRLATRRSEPYERFDEVSHSAIATHTKTSSLHKEKRSASREPPTRLGRKWHKGEVALGDLEVALADAPEPAPSSVASSAPATAPAAPAAPRGSSAPAESAIVSQSIRVNVGLLERMMTLVSELVLTRNQLLQMLRRHENSEFKVPLQRLSSITSDLQDSVMKTRMQPIGNAWAKLPRLVRDLAEELGKKIELEMTGAESELDRQVLELIRDPMIHMVRNSADHGLESPADRIRAGKPEIGRISLRAYHEGGHITIEVADDGVGLATARIRDKALRLGSASESELDRMSDHEIHEFIFKPGLSTAESLTSVSGRGVGLDVVRTNIEQIGGTIGLRSEHGRGTVFTIKIPLTLAIISALIVQSRGQRYAIPQIAVIELVRTKPKTEHQIELIHQSPVLRLRDQLLPIVDLSRVLGFDEDAAKGPLTQREALVVVTQIGSQTIGIVVDGVYDTEEIVVKPLASLLRGIPMFSGNTILGDGSVIMIIDPGGVATSVSRELAQVWHERLAPERCATGEEAKTPLLVFRAGGREWKAVQLSLVTRLEEIEAEHIERSDGRNLVQYRGRLMPLMHVDLNSRLKTKGRQPILVFTHGNRAAGLAVDEIIDIIAEKLEIELASRTDWIIGLARIKGRATEVIDVGYYLAQLFPDWLARGKGRTGLGEVKRLLLIDDSPLFLNMLSPLLGAAGYEVTAVASADDALRLRERGERFDIIVSELEMPGTDGFRFASTVKADKRWAGTRLIAFTSHSDEAARRRSREAGFDDYITKSERDHLLAVVADGRVRGGEAA